MKNRKFPYRGFMFIALAFFYSTNTNAQFLKKLGKRAEKAAERTVERRVEQETSKKTDEVLDSILEPGNKNKKATSKKGNPIPEVGSSNDSSSDSANAGKSEPSTHEGGSKSMQVYSKFDFVPGDKLLFYDDFNNDFVGDFPSKWNTNAGGDLVYIEGHENKWLNIIPGYQSVYIPDVVDLPKEFTLEFDVLGKGIDNKTSSQSYIGIVISDNESFEKGSNWAMIEYSFCQFIDRGFVIENRINGKRGLRNVTKTDIRHIVNQKHHVSVAINTQRFRVWIDEKKYVDVPRLLPKDVQMKNIKLMLRGIDTDKESIYISNIKIAEGGVDLRRKLIADGKISTNGILFETGSANIQPQSMGIIRQISQVLQQDASISLKIVGHTDADGNEESNLKLSKKRAEAVMNALINIYKMSSDRLTADGMGESQPVGDNNTSDGKSLNRRVEFIKI